MTRPAREVRYKVTLASGEVRRVCDYHVGGYEMLDPKPLIEPI